MALDPLNPSILENQASLFAYQGRFDKAVEQLDEVDAKTPGRLSTTLASSRVWARSGGNEKALELGQLSESDVNFVSLTSGRTIIWPVIIDKIDESPFVGYGRRAMQRIGLSKELGERHEEPFPHPHNAYLQLFLDNGLVLSIPVLGFFMLLLIYCWRLARDKRSPYFSLTASLASAFVLSFLLGAVAQQSFYPITSSVSLWVAIALLLRVVAERSYVDQMAPKARMHPGAESWLESELTPVDQRQNKPTDWRSHASEGFRGRISTATPGVKKAVSGISVR